MKRLFTFAATIAFSVAAASGCRRNPPADPDSLTGVPRPIWSAGDATSVEGSQLTLTLTLSRPPVVDVEVHLSTTGVGELEFPEIVTFLAGDFSQSVTITALAAEPGPTRDPVITATTANGFSELTVHVIDDDTNVGPAVGPVFFGSGVVVLSGAGTDATFATIDDEVIAARNIGTGTPVLTRIAVGSLSGTALCTPVMAPGGSVLVMASGTVPLLVQVQSVPDAPAVTATAILPAKTGGVSRPVMIGSRAVITSRGNDLVTSLDDGLLVVDGIGTTTLTVKTVLLPGLSAGEPSIPVELTTTSLLITTAGPDLLFGTGDEVLTLVAALDTPLPVVVPLFSGRIRGDASGRAIASGGTIAAVATAGADATFATADDSLRVVRNVLVLPTPALLPLVVGPLIPGDAGLPLSNGADGVVIPTLGIDLIPGNADDTVTAVFPLSSDPMTATPLSSPGGVTANYGALVLVSASSAVRISTGPDGLLGSSDDGLATFSLLNTATPFASGGTCGALQAFAPMPMDAFSVALCGLGLDGIGGTGDDVTIRAGGIGGTPTFLKNSSGAFAPLSTPIFVPGPSGRAVVARTAGADGAPGTADDRLTVAASP